MIYPKWLYSASGAVLLKSHAEEEALSGEWFDNPAKVTSPAVIEIEPDAEEKIKEAEKPADVYEPVPIQETLTIRPKLGRPSFKDKQ